MKALVKEKTGKGASLKNVDKPTPSKGEVLVKVKAAAICGTDMHIYKWNDWAKNADIDFPLIMGHEFSGEVIEVGDSVNRVSPGDYIAGETHIPCGKCFQCQNGFQHICNNLTTFGINTNGCFAEYTVLPEICARKIPENIPPEIGAIFEPLGTSLRATLSGRISGENIAVIGCGPIGLLTIASAKTIGAATIIGLDVNDERLKLAHKLGADLTFNPQKVDIISKIKEETGVGVDSIIEASGNVGALKTGLKYLRKGGTVVLVGLPAEKLEIDMVPNIIFKEAHIIGIHGREMFNTWTKMGNLLGGDKSRRKLDVESVITHEFTLENWKKGFDILEKGEGSKIILKP